MYQESIVETAIKNELRNYPRAQEAFNELVRKGVDAQALRQVLTLYVFLGYLNGPPLWIPPKRTRKKIQSDMEDLAARTEYLDLYPEISARLAEAALSDDASLNSGIVAGLPKILRNYARFIGALPSPSLQKRGSSRKNRALCELLNYVQITTGEPHYPLVAILLNAADSAAANFEVTRPGNVVDARKKKRDEPRWDSSVLAQLIYRERAGNKRQRPVKKASNP
jgi:hypothetical protein